MNLGDMVICPDYIQKVMEGDLKSAKNSTMASGNEEEWEDAGISLAMGQSSSLRDRILLLSCHGILHLMGYDHDEEKEHMEMVAAEDRLIVFLKAEGIIQ
jgi:ssRNA-specific RNase YbeY (16S rRNA maturation enzyme)